MGSVHSGKPWKATAPTPASTPVVLKYPPQLLRYLIPKFTPHQDNHRGQKTKPLKADDHLPTWAELQFLLNSLCNFFLDKEAQKMLSGPSRPSAVSLDTLSNSPPSPLFYSASLLFYTDSF